MGFSFESAWLIKWSEFSGPILYSEEKQNQINLGLLLTLKICVINNVKQLKVNHLDFSTCFVFFSKGRSESKCVFCQLPSMPILEKIR